jgi:hypothetical protein
MPLLSPHPLTAGAAASREPMLPLSWCAVRRRGSGVCARGKTGREVRSKRDQHFLGERTVELELKRADVQAKNVTNLETHYALYTSLCPNAIIDERARVHIKDRILTAISNQYLLTNGPSEPTRFLTISTVAYELGYHFEAPSLIKIGKMVKQEYIKKYNTEPPKHEQIVGGAVRPVCTYQAKDLIRTFVSEYIKPRSVSSCQVSAYTARKY